MLNSNKIDDTAFNCNAKNYPSLASKYNLCLPFKAFLTAGAILLCSVSQRVQAPVHPQEAQQRPQPRLGRIRQQPRIHQDFFFDPENASESCSVSVTRR